MSPFEASLIRHYGHKASVMPQGQRIEERIGVYWFQQDVGMWKQVDKVDYL